MIKKEVVEKFISLSLNPVPVKSGTKVPCRKDHTEPILDSELDTITFEEIGVSTGYASLNLEALDFDLKNVEDPDQYMKDFNKMIPKSLMDKMVIQSTPSGGFHYLYRCDVIESNQKLARNSEGAAVIETRGVGGYIKCTPSKGYKRVSKKTFAEISFISEKERNFLFVVSKQKDELNKRDIDKKFSKEDTESFNKFKTYNEDPDIGIELLENAGWTYHSENGDWYNFSRPNSESGDLHGGYNREDNFFQCFSTSQDQFEQRRGYNNHHLFAELECEGNYKKAYAMLYEQGYGEDVEEQDEGGTFDFISGSYEEDEYLEQARKGDIPLGASLGWAGLDGFYRLKKNSFNFFLGLDNIGKSTLISSFIVSSNILHGFKWGISSPEARVATTRRNLIEAEIGKEISRYNDSDEEYKKLRDKSRKNFHIIKNDKHLTIDDVLERGKLLFEKYGIDFLLIDPFSFYSGSGNFKEDTHVLSKIRVFCQNYCGVIVVDHPYTGFTRLSRDGDGYIKIPTKYDASGGNSKANRCDDFVSVHRVINHEDSELRKTMQISVQKVKDKSTGGKPHIDGEYSSLVWEVRDGFLGYWDSTGNNPMYKAMKSKIKVEKLVNVQQQELRRFNPEDVF